MFPLQVLQHGEGLLALLDDRLERDHKLKKALKDAGCEFGWRRDGVRFKSTGEGVWRWEPEDEAVP
jgi:hypothetical protein